MRYDSWKDFEIDEALEQLEREGKTLPQIRYSEEAEGEEK